MSHAYSKLVLPRMPQPIFKEFQTESARAYFTKKKELTAGPFKECIAQTSELISEISPHLEALSEQLSLAPDEFTYQDIHLYPKIYLLHLVNELTFPEKMQQYFDLKNKQMGAWQSAL